MRVLRRFDSIKVLKKPRLKLTKKQKADLYAQYFPFIKVGYKRKMILSSFAKRDDQPDMDQEAEIVFKRICARFDRFGLNLGKKDVPGKDKPKSLGFYFKVFSSNCINLCVKETYALNKLKVSKTLYFEDHPVISNSLAMNGKYKEDPALVIFSEQYQALPERLRNFMIAKYTKKLSRAKLKEKFKSDHKQLTLKCAEVIETFMSSKIKR